MVGHIQPERSFLCLLVYHGKPSTTLHLKAVSETPKETCNCIPFYYIHNVNRMNSHECCSCEYSLLAGGSGLWGALGICGSSIE